MPPKIGKHGPHRHVFIFYPKLTSIIFTLYIMPTNQKLIKLFIIIIQVMRSSRLAIFRSHKKISPACVKHDTHDDIKH